MPFIGREAYLAVSVPYLLFRICTQEIEGQIVEVDFWSLQDAAMRPDKKKHAVNDIDCP